mgnify:CR=1 FL=1
MSKYNEDTIRHSLSHVMASAVVKLFPEARLGIGPAIDSGFYYDFDLSHTLNPDDLPKIESLMKEIINEGHKFEKRTEEAKKAYKNAEAAGESYKAELIGDLIADGEKRVSFYKTGDFEDLCAGPHVSNTSDLKGVGFRLTKIAGAYWKGSEKNKMLQRVYAVAFRDVKSLKSYLFQLEEAEKRDHRKIGSALGLFSFQEEGVGFPFWHPKGMILKNELVIYWRKMHQNAGYQEIQTPIILKEDLWHRSGHWENYKDNMYFTEIDEEKYAIKPMNCPGGILVYKNNLYSYRDLPLRIAELGLVHRHELSGVLHGLFRVRSFVQDDAHIYCTEDQVESELAGVIKLIKKIYNDLGFSDYHIELSTKPEKSIGTKAMWDKAEKIMKRVTKDLGIKVKINEGDGAFYGPKFDFHIKDSIGRTWQCGTVQLDFSMPDRFELEYVDKDGKKKRPVMIHRTVLGSLERFIGIMTEHYAGAFPFKFAPIQVSIITVGASAKKFAKKVHKEIQDFGLRAELKDENETVGKKIRDAEMQKVPYMLVIGDKEVSANSVAVRKLHDKKIVVKKIESFLKDING